jgi:hypothetical protein
MVAGQGRRAMEAPWGLCSPGCNRRAVEGVVLGCSRIEELAGDNCIHEKDCKRISRAWDLQTGLNES